MKPEPAGNILVESHTHRKRHRYLLASQLPAIVISLTTLILSVVLGGPIAAVLAAAFVLPAWLLSGLFYLLLLWEYTPPSAVQAAVIGCLLYLCLGGFLYLLLDAFGPSQIM